MGVYDTVCGVQIKSTPDPMCRYYEIGDKIELKPGVHFGNEGWFMVKKKRIIHSGKYIYTGDGDRILPERLTGLYGIIRHLLNFQDMSCDDYSKIFDYIKKLKKEKKNNG